MLCISSSVFDFYIRKDTGSYPFLHNVIRWAISDAHYTSAKLLNASGWDDILESGKLSPWTVRQRFITIQLLNDTLTNDVGAENKHVTIAAIQSLLTFAVRDTWFLVLRFTYLLCHLMLSLPQLFFGNNHNIDRLQSFYRGFMSQTIRPDIDVWAFLTQCHYMLSYADRLRRTGDHDNRYIHASRGSHISEPDMEPQRYHDYQFAFPFDLSLFTLGQPILNDAHHLLYDPLQELYRILSISTSFQPGSLSGSTYDYVVSLHNRLFPYLPNQELALTNSPVPDLGHTLADANDWRIAPARLSTFILTSYLLCNNAEKEEDSRALTKLASSLRTLLGSAVDVSRNHADWIPFPGALLWCHAIGVQFAHPGHDRTWFLMQFLRVSHPSILEAWEATSRSRSDCIQSGTDRLGRNR